VEPSGWASTVVPPGWQSLRALRSYAARNRRFGTLSLVKPEETA
jgi:hypothetical protein